MDFEKRVANKRMPAQKICSIQFFKLTFIVHRLNKNIFDQNMFTLQWFKEYLFCRLNPNPESKEDLRENISKVAA